MKNVKDVFMKPNFEASWKSIKKLYMRILWDKEHFITLEQEFIEFECERCIDEAKDWSELIVHKENSHGDVGAGIGSIQVKLSNCDKCGHNCVLRNRFGSHIQSLHVWTDHMKPDVPVKSLFSTEYDKDLTTKAVKMLITSQSVQSSGRIKPPPFLLRSCLHCYSHLHPIHYCARKGV